MNPECEMDDDPCKTPSKVGEIEKEMEKLSFAIEETGKLLTVLCQKLVPITKTEEDSEKCSGIDGDLCQLAHYLCEKRNSVSTHNQRIEDLLERIEL